jgi:hypothetical protein
MRPVLSKAFVALAIASVAAFGADNTLGTWKLNVEKSKFTPNPTRSYKSLTFIREASDGGVRQTATGEFADGTVINASYTLKYDGKEVQISGNGGSDTIAVKQVDANTLTEVRTRRSNKSTGQVVISNSGKTMTWTSKGTNADGKEFVYVHVFDKQ